MTNIRIGQSADHGFDQPLGLLSDCHRRVEHFLSVLSEVARSEAGRPITANGRNALEGALQYFATAGPRHTADEEESLFPRLTTAAPEQSNPIANILHSLEADHRTAERLHAEVDVLAHRWIEAETLSTGDASALRSALDSLSDIYRRHIEIEDRDVFPAAARALDADLLERIGREMAARRNVDYLPPPDLRRGR